MRLQPVADGFGEIINKDCQIQMMEHLDGKMYQELDRLTNRPRLTTFFIIDDCTCEGDEVLWASVARPSVRGVSIVER